MRGYPAIELDGAIVLVTGAARGIGRATAETFAKRGARVVLGDLDAEAVHEAAAAIGRGALGFSLDVASRTSFAAFVEGALAAHGRIDILVNNAGLMPLGGFLEQSDAIGRVTFDVNVWGLVHGMKLVLPGMIAGGRGHIVNVASMAGKIGLPGMAVYNASKFAAVGLSAAVRREHAQDGVSVSAILPSAVRTGLVAGVPLGRGLPTIEPEEVADAIVRSCASRRAEIPLPAYVGVWDLVEAIAPERVLALGRRLLGERRVLTSVDPVARSAYEERIAKQAAGRA
jgi:NAD(P)-dependent dehydrogenase (short-subunit alcohol dehydrogenase family)